MRDANELALPTHISRRETIIGWIQISFLTPPQHSMLGQLKNLAFQEHPSTMMHHRTQCRTSVTTNWQHLESGE